MVGAPHHHPCFVGSSAARAFRCLFTRRCINGDNTGVARQEEAAGNVNMEGKLFKAICCNSYEGRKKTGDHGRCFRMKIGNGKGEQWAAMVKNVRK